jgi:hypothetical protein
MLSTYYNNSPGNYQKFAASSCQSNNLESPYDQTYGKPFCQKAQSAYTGPDKAVYGIYTQMAQLNNASMKNVMKR